MFNFLYLFLVPLGGEQDRFVETDNLNCKNAMKKLDFKHEGTMRECDSANLTSNNMNEKYLMVTQDAGRKFILRQIEGSVVMLNLLRFREQADYSASPELMPATPISGKQAYQLYIEHTLPFLTKSGGEILFMGEGGDFLIGPPDEYWDAVLLIKQNSVNSFLAFESDQEYMKGIGHRTAAIVDSRLLPVIQSR